jgi:beta-lactamase superfamily II metal-dependent hydrolase
MMFRVFNVGHGFCAILRADNGNVMLFDCGHDDERGFRPSRVLSAAGITTIGYFVIGNYDADHVSDLHNVRQVAHIEYFVHNPTVSADELQRIKRSIGQIPAGMEALIDLKRGGEAVRPPFSPEPVFPNATLTTFHAPYSVFGEDTNNLSLVSFLDMGGVRVVIPADLERAGWLYHLQNPSFRTMLAGVHVFVASHHGRESGYCEEVFNFCRPAIFIISDREKCYDTQENSYANHATGLTWPDGQTRYVLTTRCDGYISVYPDLTTGGYRLTVQSDEANRAA